MAEKEVSPYILYHLAMDGPVVRLEIQEFHPNAEEVTVNVFEAEIELSGKVYKSQDVESLRLTHKQARSLYRRLLRRGYRVSHNVIDDFLAGVLRKLENLQTAVVSSPPTPTSRICLGNSGVHKTQGVCHGARHSRKNFSPSKQTP